MKSVSSNPHWKVQPPPLAELARLCRRVCIRREQTATTSLRSLEDDLANALAIVREKFGENAANEDDLASIYSQEHQRIDDYATLTELLISRIVPSTLPASASTTGTNQSVSTHQPPSQLPPPTNKNPSQPPKSPPGIADLLDGMIAQERAA